MILLNVDRDEEGEEMVMRATREALGGIEAVFVLLKLSNVEYPVSSVGSSLGATRGEPIANSAFRICSLVSPTTDQ